MSDVVAVSVEGLNKRFRKSSEPAKTIKDRVISWRTSETKTFHALQDVNFDVKIGESLGILGHNGSGKSTLLKTIAGTIRPSSGTVKVRGRLAALLELGAGFHPDLTGRENVYLNGSVLGFSKGQVDKIFDKIVSFAELPDFIDTQVKHYSSGMYARLGFAVAINLDPDVLIIDEVLAVGDEAFQRKCLAQIGEFQLKEKTLLLVTHSPQQVIDVCDKAIVLDHGKLIYAGDTQTAAVKYRESIYGHGERPVNADLAENNPHKCLDITSARVVSDLASGTIVAGARTEFVVDVDCESSQAGQLRVMVHNHANVEMLNLSTLTLTGEALAFTPGTHKLHIEVDRLNLAAGVYAVSVRASDGSGDLLFGSADRIAKFNVTSDSPDTGNLSVSARVSFQSVVNKDQ